MRLFRFACGVAVLLALSGGADAALVTVQLTGTVTQVPLDELFGDISTGDAIAGSYTFDTTAADLVPGNAATGSYTWTAPLGMMVTIGSHGFQAFGLLNIGILDSFVDQYTVFARNAAGDTTLGLFLQDNSHTVFSDDSLPFTAPALSGFTQRDFHLIATTAGGELQVDGQISSLVTHAVPEPSALGLVLPAFILFVSVRAARISQDK
jgi:hypothetical protein